MYFRPTTEENVEFYFNDLFIDNDTSFSSEDSLLSSGISDDETLAQSEALQGEEGLQNLESADSSVTKPVLQEEKTEVEEEKESQSLKQEKYTRYVKFCISIRSRFYLLVIFLGLNCNWKASRSIR